MDKCSDLLPDYFSFVKGLVDSYDIALNISRETMQKNHQVALIAKNTIVIVTAAHAATVTTPSACNPRSLNPPP